jgi:hypothetical protein
MQSLEPKRKDQEAGKGRPIPQTENPDRENNKNRSDQEEDVNYEEENDQDSEEQDDLEEEDDEEEEEDKEDDDKKKPGKGETLDEKLDRLDPFNEHSPKREDAELGIGKSGSRSPSRPNTGSSGSRGNTRNDNNGRKGPGSSSREELKKKGTTKNRPAASTGASGSNGKAAPAKGQDKKAVTRNASQNKKPSAARGKTSR